MKTLNTKEAAALLGCCAKTLLELVKDGVIPAARFGRGFRFLEDELVSVMRNHNHAKEKALRLEKESWRSRKEAMSGIAVLSAPMAVKLDALLGPKTSSKPKKHL